jgi:hypothetical protein
MANASPADVSRDVAEMFRRAEQSGLKLAIKGRTVTLVVLGAWLVITRSEMRRERSAMRRPCRFSPSLAWLTIRLIATRFDKPWIKYAFVTLDIAIALGARSQHSRCSRPLRPAFGHDLPRVDVRVLFRDPRTSPRSASPSGLVLWTASPAPFPGSLPFLIRQGQGRSCP